MEPPIPVSEYGSDSPLRQPAVFFAAWGRDWGRARVLGWRLFLQDLASSYRHAWLGLLWVAVPPVVLPLGLALGQRLRFLDLGEYRLPLPVYVVVGMALWQVLLSGLHRQRGIFEAYRYQLSRQRLPIEGLILAQACHGVLEAAIGLALAAGACLAWGVTPAAGGAGLLLAMLLAWLAGSVAGLLLAPFAVLVPDLGKAVPILAWAAFFATPVVYPLPAPTGWLRLIHANPLTHLFEAARLLATGHGQPAAAPLVVLLVVLAVALPLALLLCRVALPHVLERAAL